MSCAINVVSAYLGNSRTATTAARYQWNYGQVLRINGIDLPHSFQVHFSNTPKVGTSTTSIGTGGEVVIPDAYLTTGKTVYAWIFLHNADTDGETMYAITIPVIPRPQPTDEEPTPVQQSEINQLIDALNSGVDRAETAADSAEAAQTAAETAAGESAASATTAAQKASEAAISAGNAEQSAQAAVASATAAEGSAAAASQAATNAAESATAAQDSADDAADSADRAEQAAGQAGYMFFYINEDGDLIYQRTPNVDVDFYLDDGDLYVRATA